jgi:diguanylate cyclase (GGDEF)-like protein
VLVSTYDIVRIRGDRGARYDERPAHEASSADARPLPSGVATAAGLLAVAAGSAIMTAYTGDAHALAGVLMAMVGVGAAVPAARLVVPSLLLMCGIAVAGVVAAELTSVWLDAGVAAACALALSLAIFTARRRDAAQLHAVRRDADASSVDDRLTGLLNRRGLDLLVAPMLEGARRRGDALHCHVVDVDRFHQVSAVVGVETANDVLVSTAEALRASIRGTDVVARWEAHEFVVVGPGSGTPAEELERRVRTYLTTHPPVDARTWSPGVVVGSALLPPWESGTLDTVLDQAAEAMKRRRSLHQLGRMTASAADAASSGDPAADGPRGSL